MTFEAALELLTPSWRLTHLLHLEPEGWQANLSCEEDAIAVLATGDTPGNAVLNAIRNTYDSKHYMSLYRPSDHASFEPGEIRTSLDIAKLFFRREPINRRL